MPKYTKIPADTFKTLQVNAGVVLDDFDPENPWTTEQLLEHLCFATSGGVLVKTTPTYSDQGEGIDNCPVNVKELKKLDSVAVEMSGTAKTISPEFAKEMLGSADVETISVSLKKIVPRMDLKMTDFLDKWLVGDYGKDGFVAVHISEALNTDGFSMQTADKDKGSFPFKYVGHYSINAQDRVPLEIYIAESTDSELDDVVNGSQEEK